MTHLQQVLLGLTILVLALPGNGQVEEATTVGRLEIVPLESRVFGNTRNIRVWLPGEIAPGEKAGRLYPVLYVNDGEDLFDAGTSVYFSAEWQFDETLSHLLRKDVVEPFIVVGIDSGGRASRAREYLPYRDEFLSPPVRKPSGMLYADFLETEVIPIVEARFPARTDKRGRALGGSSYGALVALHVAMSRPGLFDRLLLESPSLYVDDFHILRDLQQNGLSVSALYLGAGTGEIGSGPCGSHPPSLEVVEGIVDLAHLLIRLGMPRRYIRLEVAPCATHSPVAWAERLPAALTFLFGE